MPLMSSKTFNEIKCYINSAYSLASQTVLNYVHNSLQNAYRKLDQNGPNTVTDVAVSFDGTWLTRGHTSQIGIGCVVDTLTGYVIDYEIMSKLQLNTMFGILATNIPARLTTLGHQEQWK
ncbi:uncharacterized protein TNCV_3185241 [Trichonephila clavipes]|nr:uncharacterized protein TNCV_3185241 [Trichonephila clavipes]